MHSVSLPMKKVKSSVGDTVFFNLYPFIPLLSVHALLKGGYGQNGYETTATLYQPSSETLDLGDGFVPKSLDCGMHFCCSASTNHLSKCWGYGHSTQKLHRFLNIHFVLFCQLTFGRRNQYGQV